MRWMTCAVGGVTSTPPRVSSGMQRAPRCRTLRACCRWADEDPCWQGQRARTAALPWR